jgi:hypothetical protein
MLNHPSRRARIPRKIWLFLTILLTRAESCIAVYHFHWQRSSPFHDERSSSMQDPSCSREALILILDEQTGNKSVPWITSPKTHLFTQNWRTHSRRGKTKNGHQSRQSRACNTPGQVTHRMRVKEFRRGEK